MSLVAEAAAWFSSGCDFSRNFSNIGNVLVAKLLFIKIQLYSFSRAAVIIIGSLAYASSRLCFTSVYFYFLIFLIFLFTVRSQKLLNRFSPNFQELCILV